MLGCANFRVNSTFVRLIPAPKYPQNQFWVNTKNCNKKHLPLNEERHENWLKTKPLASNDIIRGNDSIRCRALMDTRLFDQLLLKTQQSLEWFQYFLPKSRTYHALLRPGHSNYSIVNRNTTVNRDGDYKKKRRWMRKHQKSEGQRKRTVDNQFLRCLLTAVLKSLRLATLWIELSKV